MDFLWICGFLEQSSWPKPYKNGLSARRREVYLTGSMTSSLRTSASSGSNTPQDGMRYAIWVPLPHTSPRQRGQFRIDWGAAALVCSLMQQPLRIYPSMNVAFRPDEVYLFIILHCCIIVKFYVTIRTTEAIVTSDTPKSLFNKLTI